MSSFTTTTVGVGAAVLAAGTLVAALPATSTAAVRALRVPCDATALAEAISAANATSGRVLRLTPRCRYDIATPATAATGLPTITGDVTLLGGPGTTIRRDPNAAAFRVFDVAAGARLRISGIAVLNGLTAGLGGGIQNAGQVVLNQVTLAGNTAANGGALADLAGSRTTVARTVLKQNAATSVGGGALINFAVTTLYASAVLNNTGPVNGGGVNTQPGGTTLLIRSTVENNVSGGLGGGLSNLGTTTLSRTLVRLNKGSSGGGIATGNANVLLSRSVVTRNLPDNCSPLNTIPGCTD
jgi:hypothetical protein